MKSAINNSESLNILAEIVEHHNEQPYQLVNFKRKKEQDYVDLADVKKVARFTKHDITNRWVPQALRTEHGNSIEEMVKLPEATLEFINLEEDSKDNNNGKSTKMGTLEKDTETHDMIKSFFRKVSESDNNHNPITETLDRNFGTHIPPVGEIRKEMIGLLATFVASLGVLDAVTALSYEDISILFALRLLVRSPSLNVSCL